MLRDTINFVARPLLGVAALSSALVTLAGFGMGMLPSQARLSNEHASRGRKEALSSALVTLTVIRLRRRLRG